LPTTDPWGTQASRLFAGMISCVVLLFLFLSAPFQSAVLKVLHARASRFFSSSHVCCAFFRLWW
jgi:hypothetical protein